MSEAPRKNRKQVVEALHEVAAEMHNRMQRGEPPKMTLPVRSKTNISFDNKLGVFKYGRTKLFEMLQSWDPPDNSYVHCTSQSLLKR